MKYHNDGFFISERLAGHGIKHGFGTHKFDLYKYFNGTSLKIPTTDQIHGSKIIYLEDVATDKTYYADSWVTKKNDICCHVRTADCLPALICDPKNGIISAVHAGWRGMSEHILKKTIQKFVGLGSLPQDIIVAIGPHICKSCYEVKQDVLGSFENNDWDSTEIFGEEKNKLYLDLETAACLDLRSSHVERTNIETDSLCTFCRPDLFYSYRRTGDGNGRMNNFIASIT